LYHYGAGTNVGNVRDNNEDSLVCDHDKGLWIVADGMGGLGFGEVASAITTYTVTTMIREGHGVNQAIEVAHRNIKEYAETDGLGTNMGTTIVLLLSQGSLYNVFWVGDSRAYLLDEKEMKQVTVDHSLVQSLIDQGELTKEEAETDPRKNAVTRALGVQELETVRADSVSERWQPGQKLLLCSDGLTDCVTDKNIEKIMRNSGNDDQVIVDNLIEAALEGGGKDNITIVVVSAPATAKISDTDTHVPGQARGDDTHIPANDDTQHPGDKTEPRGQLALDISEPGQKILTLPAGSSVSSITKQNGDSAETTIEDDDNRSGWLNLGGVIAASVVLFLAVMSMNPDEAPSGLAKKFVGEELKAVVPIRRNLPDIDMDEPSPLVQVGVFQHLQGAESKQRRLTSLGLSPDIVKRATEVGIRYAVVISPTDETDHRHTLATLQANNLNYFHARRHGT
jgi:PPM family protein phosphatase